MGGVPPGRQKPSKFSAQRAISVGVTESVALDHTQNSQSVIQGPVLALSVAFCAQQLEPPRNNCLHFLHFAQFLAVKFEDQILQPHLPFRKPQIRAAPELPSFCWLRVSPVHP
jgi:hypothetical protein